MCGISGIINFKEQSQAAVDIKKMVSAMKHRGPDDDGIWLNHKVALAQTRLSIIDLSSLGHQPMWSNNQQVVMVFNGEIYNFKTLKASLSDYDFQTQTDSEVILAAYLKWGISFVEHLDGMFAIALYDCVADKVFLIRDRLGVKPMYYYVNEQHQLSFASEIRTIMKGQNTAFNVNDTALGDFLTFHTVTSNETLVNGIKSLEAGTYLEIQGDKIAQHTYWSINKQNKNTDTYEKAVETVKDLFFKAVDKRLMADVPLGAFLSGGIDSSAIVAAMHECGNKPNTFNISFADEAFSEAPFAKKIADLYQTKHTEIKLLPEDFLKVLPEAVKALDHPSIDGLNAYVVSMATKNAGITVALSGVGGDEWFAGYPVFHSIYHDKYVWIKRIPKFLRILMVNAINFIKKDVSLERKMEWLKSDMGPIDLYKATKQLFSQRQLKQLLKKPMSANDTVMPIQSLSDVSVLEWNKYLMPVLLRDTDQMGMAHALEIREPFMDYQMIEYVLSLPDKYKIGAKPKQLLVDAMGDLLPDEIVSRKKMGFVLPYEKWMKTELKSFVLEGIAMLKQKNVLNNASVDFYVDSYFQNKHNVRWNMIWSLTILGHWLHNNDIHHD